MKPPMANRLARLTTFEIPLTREEALVEKTTNITGAVRARKVSNAEHKNISTPVRKEDVEVDRDVETDDSADASKAPKTSLDADQIAVGSKSRKR